MLTPDVNVRFGDILVAFARGILSRDEVYDDVAAETSSSIEHLSNNGIDRPTSWRKSGAFNAEPRDRGRPFVE